MSSVEARIRQWLNARRQDRHPLLAGDPDAEPVLRELLNDSSHHVTALARVGLDRIEKARKEAPGS